MNTPAAIPGQYLGPASKFQPGPGTHLHNGNIWASVLGTISTSTPGLTSSQEQAEAPKKLAGPPKRLTRIAALAEPRDSPQSRSQALLPVISVCTAGGSNSRGENGEEGGGGGGGKREVLPEVDQTVLCRVMRIMPRQAVVNILVVNETNVLEGEWQGVIRVQDVRATEKDKVRMVESFRPGDIVRARVISLGDQANYYLATTSNELGVVMATSEAGNVMYPVSWKEYKDPETGMSEGRKVARPF